MISEASPSPTKRVSMRATGRANSTNSDVSPRANGADDAAGDATKGLTKKKSKRIAAPDIAPPVPRSIAQCLRCGFQWFTRVEHPLKCPNCKSKKWDVPRSEDKLLTRKPRGKSFTREAATVASAKAAALRIAKARRNAKTETEDATEG